MTKDDWRVTFWFLALGEIFFYNRSSFMMKQMPFDFVNIYA